MKNKLADLNEALFDQLEKLNSEDDDASLKLEIERTKSIVEVSKQIIDVHRVALDAIKAAPPEVINEYKFPATFGLGMVMKQLPGRNSGPDNKPYKFAGNQ